MIFSNLLSHHCHHLVQTSPLPAEAHRPSPSCLHFFHFCHFIHLQSWWQEWDDFHLKPQAEHNIQHLSISGFSPFVCHENLCQSARLFSVMRVLFQELEWFADSWRDENDWWTRLSLKWPGQVKWSANEHEMSYLRRCDINYCHSYSELLTVVAVFDFVISNKPCEL